jgi:hypothetical protein
MLVLAEVPHDAHDAADICLVIFRIRNITAPVTSVYEGIIGLINSFMKPRVLLFPITPIITQT